MKGIYLLVINVRKNIKIKVGKIRILLFKKGNYVYVGSAQNNLEKRIQRHLRKHKKKFWHIDIFLVIDLLISQEYFTNTRGNLKSVE